MNAVYTLPVRVRVSMSFADIQERASRDSSLIPEIPTLARQTVLQRRSGAFQTYEGSDDMNTRLPFFNYAQLNLDVHESLIVDCFAGGGGVSLGIEWATGRRVDIAINHDEDALSLHAKNHSETLHLRDDIRAVDPRIACAGRPVGLLHLSPDCRDHSQSKGGQPRSKEIRGLTWQALKWAGTVTPTAISVENVKQILNWGPLVAKRDKASGRVMRLDGTVAAKGERVPVGKQFLIPDPKRAGLYWRKFVGQLGGMGYFVEWKILCAADYGVPTTRERLFMFARRDGKPIVWPKPTHFKHPKPGQKKWVPAADIIDWSIPCPSIFQRKKPLAEATERRIAKGIKRFVLDNPDPFIVPVTHQGRERVHDLHGSLRTDTPAHHCESALLAPMVVQAGHGEGKPGGPKRWSHGSKAITDPIGTITASGSGQAIGVATLVQADYSKREGPHPLRLPLEPILDSGVQPAPVLAYLAQQNGGFNTTPGHDANDPVSTITNRGSQQQVVTAHLATLRRNCIGRSADEPLATLTAGAEHHAVVQVKLEQELGLNAEQMDGSLRVAAFLIRYYGQGGQLSSPQDPMPTITTRDRLALVTVTIKGTPFIIVDLGLRMLTPTELFAAQGFPPSYAITHGHDGRKLTKKTQVRLVGNSVCPALTEALIRSNLPEMAIFRARKAA